MAPDLLAWGCCISLLSLSFFSLGTRGMSLGVKGLPVYEEGEEPKTEIKEKNGERETESGVTLGGER